MLNKRPSQKQLDDERKDNEFHDLMKLSQYSSLVKIKALDAGRGHPPTRYEVEYKCKGYRSSGSTAEYFKVYMTLPADYPRSLPVFQYDPKTPVYHPNVYSGGNFCIGGDSSMPMGLPLREYIVGVGQMIQWRKPGTITPIDTRSLVGKEPLNFLRQDTIEAPPPPLKKSDIVIFEEPELEINIISDDNNKDNPLDITILE